MLAGQLKEAEGTTYDGPYGEALPIMGLPFSGLR